MRARIAPIRKHLVPISRGLLIRLAAFPFMTPYPKLNNSRVRR